MHGQEKVVFADAGYQGVDKRPDAKPEVQWHVAMRSGKRKALDKSYDVPDQEKCPSFRPQWPKRAEALILSCSSTDKVLYSGTKALWYL